MKRWIAVVCLVAGVAVAGELQLETPVRIVAQLVGFEWGRVLFDADTGDWTVSVAPKIAFPLPQNISTTNGVAISFSFDASVVLTVSRDELAAYAGKPTSEMVANELYSNVVSVAYSKLMSALLEELDE